MCAIIIDSKVSDLDKAALESRLCNLLEAVKSQFKTIYVSVQLKCQVDDLDLNYRCEVEGVCHDTSRLLACSEHGNLMSALRLAVSSLGQALSLEMQARRLEDSYDEDSATLQAM